MELATKRFEEEHQGEGAMMHYVMEMPSMQDGTHSGYALDASRKGNISRLINHSCAANCETQKWLVAGEMRVGIFAKRFIPAGREISYDYCFVHLGGNSLSAA
jgi:SET domain-containing protein